MPSQPDKRQAWAAAHRAYADAVDVVLGKERHGSHELDVIEALAAEARRALAEYRVSRGEAPTTKT